MSQDKPVAQEPIAWMHGTAGRFEVIHAEVKKLWERVGKPAQFAKEVVSCKVENYTIPLYDHAAPCARCEELKEKLQEHATTATEFMLIDHPKALAKLQAKITEQAAEIERIRDSNTFQLNSQAERIKELEAAKNEWKNRYEANLKINQLHSSNNGMLLAKLTAANAVIEETKFCLLKGIKNMRGVAWNGDSVAYMDEALAAIADYDKGEGA